MTIVTDHPNNRTTRRWLAVYLAAALFLMRLSRASAEENSAGYRHEYYVEDNHRIKVETESAHFEVGLGPKLRLNGDLVLDAISGATPTGAPPQTKWPFPTFQDLYQTAFGQAQAAFGKSYASVYSSLFNEFVAENQTYVDAGYLTYQQMTNSAAKVALAKTPTILKENAITVANIANSSATDAFQSLTNSPNYRRTTVPLTDMHDRRVALSLGFPITVGRHLITPSVSYSEESDYVSTGGALNDAVSFNNKNTTLNLGWSHNSDNVRDDTFVWRDKMTDDFLIGLVQLLTPKSYLTANFTFSNETGYLSDPYRGVMAAANFPQTNPDDAALLPEKRPRYRTKEIVYLSWTQFIDPLHGSLETGYRYFHDSSQLDAHTVDVQWHQKIGKRIVISPSFRYYYQTAANFYNVLVPDFNNLPSAYSSDYRLSEFQSFSYGVRVTYRIQQHFSIDLGYTRYEMQGLDKMTSASAYPSAHVFSIGARLWF
jgi:hypothetical protein